VVNAMQIASQRGLTVAEQHDPQAGRLDAVGLELTTSSGVLSV